MNKTINFLKERFSDYYKKKFISLPEIDLREFGIGDFNKKISQRHFCFSSEKELKNFLVSFTPFFISYSLACYKNPASTPMQKKEFIKADIVYEFDSNDLMLCTHEKNFPCNNCLGAVKDQVISLIDLIEKNFGFKKPLINFSGNKGYHVHLQDHAIQKLDKLERIELLDFISLHDFDLKKSGFFFDEKIFRCPKHNLGWAGLIKRNLINFYSELNSKELSKKFKVSKEFFDEALKNNKKLIKKLNEGVLMQLPGRKTMNFWNVILNEVIEKNSIKVDRQVSVDLSRLIRLPESLHGSSGLSACKVKDIDSFNPFVDSIVFSEKPITVFIRRSPKFELNENSFGPFKNQLVSLPEYAAIYLMTKNLAFLR